ncbi:hypothetical protein EDD18DRAFT_1358218 [Armillaria luteobubalina]|uniref:Uncharacterized protein n=1 Tax=Armillaria luteobubalina TaxID=153913 RepID=A0AA39PX15_9AGAR|nr:hypothetical protein EDD18DRAFT_1358218 [Armillaria luteobubalina]
MSTYCLFSSFLSRRSNIAEFVARLRRMSTSLLYELVLVQRIIASGSPINSIAPSPLNPTIAFVPATADVWVNGFLNLTTTVVTVLVR